MTHEGWLRPTVTLVIAYVIAMLVAARLPPLYDWDWLVFERLAALHRPVLSPNVVAVDLRDYDGSTDAAVTRTRETLARFLDRVRALPNRQQPRAVVLDFFFSRGPDASALARALASMPESVPVYATANIQSDATEPAIASRRAAAAIGTLDPAIVDRLAGIGHTIFGRHAASDGLAYQACYPLALHGAVQNVWALPHVVVPPDTPPPCDPARREIVRIGDFPPDQRSARIDRAHPFPATSLAGKIVIVGALEQDVGGLSNYPNPLILGWSISNVLQNDDHGFYAPLLLERSIVLLVIGYSLITVLAFAAFFAAGRRLALGALRRPLPWLSAGVAALVGFVVLGGLEFALLAAYRIQPQVSLSACGIVLSAVLCGVRGRQIQLDAMRLAEIEPGQHAEHDVFISYARENWAFVEKEVLLPLRAARVNGRPLRVFIDKSIEIGTVWLEQIALAIEGSTFIVLVYSPTYFGRKFCHYEVERVWMKWTTTGGKERIFPIMLGHPAIPSEFNDIEAVSVEDDPGVVRSIVEKIVEHVGAEAAK